MLQTNKGKGFITHFQYLNIVKCILKKISWTNLNGLPILSVLANAFPPTISVCLFFVVVLHLPFYLHASCT